VARYRLVETRIWTDAKVRSLSKPQPCGQSLFFRLLTGPETIIIPGVLVVTRAGLAEKLGWDAKGFAKAFAELSAKGMAKADWEAGLVWLPNGVRHNSPANPNVVKGWAKEWPEVPECPLKGEILQALRNHIEGLGEGFAKAFAERFPDGSPNQEQDTGSRIQEQEAGEMVSPSAPAPSPPEYSDEVIEIAQYLYDAIREHSPDAFSTQPKKVEALLLGWCKAIDLGMRKGTKASKSEKGFNGPNMTLAGAKAVIDLAHRGADDFWHRNMISGSSLRNCYARLVIDARKAYAGNRKANGRPDLSSLDDFDFQAAGQLWKDLEDAERRNKTGAR